MQEKLSKTSSKKLVLLGAATILVVAAGLGTYSFLTRENPNQFKKEAPSFTALTPSGEKPDWKRSKPGSDNSVYVFSDAVNDADLKISQQPLPPSFQSEPSEKIAEMARNFNATDTMQIDRMTVYIGTSAQGPQSVIFTNGKLLILIKSDKTISNGAWADYISSLE